MLLGACVSEGGNVIFPCSPSGIVFDIIEGLHFFLANAGLPRLPFYFISPVADVALGYGDIVGEWMAESRQEKLFLPDTPLLNSELLRSGRLQFFPNLRAAFSATPTFSEPCLVFCGHPSLRCGDVVQLLQMWGANSKNLLALTDPMYEPTRALGPYQPLNIKVTYNPIDLRLPFSEANHLIDRLKPKVLCVPASYVSPNASDAPSSGGLNPRKGLLPIDGMVTTFVPTQVLKLPIQRGFERAFLSESLLLLLLLLHVVSS